MGSEPFGGRGPFLSAGLVLKACSQLGHRGLCSLRQDAWLLCFLTDMELAVPVAGRVRTK